MICVEPQYCVRGHAKATEQYLARHKTIHPSRRKSYISIRYAFNRPDRKTDLGVFVFYQNLLRNEALPAAKEVEYAEIELWPSQLLLRNSTHLTGQYSIWSARTRWRLGRRGHGKKALFLQRVYLLNAHSSKSHLFTSSTKGDGCSFPAFPRRRKDSEVREGLIYILYIFRLHVR